MTDTNATYTLPAEWYEQSAIQLTWPHGDTDWLPYLDDITNTFVQMAQVITLHEKLLVVSPNTSKVRTLLENKLSNTQMERVIFFECPTNDTWARDHGAITLLHDGHPVLLDYKFNGWGEKFLWEKDNTITRQLSAHSILQGTLEDHTDFVLEGGSIECDGARTVFTTSQCLMAPHRNQPLTQAEIEQRLRQQLHAERIVWLDHGNLVGDDTDGHIDTIVRCAPNDTLLYVGCDDESDEQYADFKALEKQLQSLRTSEGEPYRLLKLPMPTAIYDDGERLPATYANFVILNRAVICPTYAQPDNDQRAIETIREAFPEHEIVGIDARTVIRQHGSLHCLTMQFPIGVI
ncbi:agmatine deiminase family protein [Prevotella sp. S7 MS 2]|uniref:agmatine deiminase family protein n=1 Tax=Prevotella sp. S7 MS 2 TaxID=1287488 RepID=UPI0005136BFE|nr:agmatine deiminase family protein [Prevotella sp. S7 MS 2]KGI59618.1 peptidyl-arginine deiminase [Prevotella sp. S7 MS 2]